MTCCGWTRIALTGASVFALAACGGGDPYIDDGETAGPADEITVTGVISQGQRCPLLTADDGTVYSLAGAQGVSVDHRYEISGLRVDDSVCVDGDIAVSVSTVTEDFETPDTPDASPLDSDYVLGAWTHRGGDCARPDFDVTSNTAGGQVVETSLDGAPRTGYVRLGDEPAFIFDQPLREFPLEARRAQSLAVLPADGDPVSLGGQTIAGDGVVFIKCAEEFVEPDTGE
jgi:hypothetical protein